MRRKDSLSEFMKKQQNNYLVSLLIRVKGNVSSTSRLSGVYRTSLYKLFRKHGINPKAYRK